MSISSEQHPGSAASIDGSKIRRDVPVEDAELTHTGPGTPMGEYMRRFWQPVCLSEDLTDLPKAIRILNEDLVAFRDKRGKVGVLHRHCSHRGTSLEYGIVSERGIRCCYHGWLFDVDGRVLETPGEPPDSKLKDSLFHGAYPALEKDGLVFAYMGPPESRPSFPIYDTFDSPDTRVKAYSIWHSCNWLQNHENAMDHVHGVFLHSNISDIQITPAWGVMPVMQFMPTDNGNGAMWVAGRRMQEDRIWLRTNHGVLPNFVQVGTLWEYGEREHYFTRASLIRWTVPIDDRHCWIFGWRYFNDVVDPRGEGDWDAVGPGMVDFAPGQSGDRPYEEKQRQPGDWDAIVSQRPIAVHDLEHLGTTDAGVVLHRRLLRQAVRGETPPNPHFAAGLGTAERPVPSYVYDTVLKVPPVPGTDERDLIADVAKRVNDVVLDADDVVGPERQRIIAERIQALEAEYA